MTDSDLFSKMTPEARLEYELFLRHVSKTDREILSTPLVILVWGPGQESPLFKKRQQIRDQLIIEGHAAIMSEEIIRDKSEMLTLHDLEYSEALNADLILVLTTSFGSLGEALTFGTDETLARKFWILAPKEYRSKGFVGLGPLATLENVFNNVYFYEDDDLTSCNLVKQVIQKAHYFRAAKYRLQKNHRLLSSQSI